MEDPKFQTMADEMPPVVDWSKREKPMDCSPSASQQASEINNLNAKLAYDSAAQLQHQSLVDNQVNARAVAALTQRAAEDAQTIKQLAAVNVLTASQTGETENQQTVSPIRTGAGDAIAAVPGVAAGLVSMSGGDIAQIVAQTVAAIVPLVLAAAGTGATASK